MDSKKNKTAALLESLKRNDEKAIKELYDNAFHYCASFVLNNSGNMEDARSIFQECLIILVRNLKKEDFSLQANIRTYLYGITRNLWLKKLRKDEKSGLSLVVDNPDSGFRLKEAEEEENSQEKENQIRRMEEALEAHSEECRQLLRLFFYEAMNSREVAEAMDYSENYVRKKKMKCIKALREKLKRA